MCRRRAALGLVIESGVVGGGWMGVSSESSTEALRSAEMVGSWVSWGHSSRQPGVRIGLITIKNPLTVGCLYIASPAAFLRGL